MAWTGMNDLVTAARQRLPWIKTTTRTTVGNTWFTMFDIAGNPGAGVLAGTSTTAGVVPTAATAGMPVINAFGGGAEGRLTRLWGTNTVVSIIRVYDLLFKAGAYANNANVNLTGQPSFASRLPGGSYAGLEIWAEQVTAATGNQAVNVQYTDAVNGTLRQTGAVGIAAAPTVGRCWQLPLQAGDSSPSLITNVTGTVASAGTFNVLVLRPLGEIYVSIANGGYLQNFADLGIPQVFADSAFYFLVMPTSTSSGLPNVQFDVSNK